eukprot:m.217552 g.217552  ORF g.217552 m.217552 type:complete len:324 (-) comp54110_c0_seq1:281-1252(-)
MAATRHLRHSDNNRVPPAHECRASERASTPKNRFEMGSLLGSGTFARVWTARDNLLGKEVAVKHMLKADAQATFERQLQEYGITKDLEHPNIIKMHDCLLSDTEIAFVQELAAGGDLFSLVVADIGAPLRESFSALNQLTAALVYLAEVGVVHRDIKPENIVRDVDGNIKLCDFGMAERVGTMVRGARGTIAYLACDLLPRRRDVNELYPVSCSSDIWGLGLIFYALITGAHPWTRADPAERHYAAFLSRTHFRSYPWKIFPAKLHHIFERLFEANPSKRCSLTEFQTFLASDWSTVELFQERADLLRQAFVGVSAAAHATAV